MKLIDRRKVKSSTLRAYDAICKRKKATIEDVSLELGVGYGAASIYVREAYRAGLIIKLDKVTPDWGRPVNVWAPASDVALTVAWKDSAKGIALDQPKAMTDGAGSVLAWLEQQDPSGTEGVPPGRIAQKFSKIQHFLEDYFAELQLLGRVRHLENGNWAVIPAW